MANHLAHFAVCVDDTDRARKFYEKVFGWGFEPFGPPGFYIVHTDGLGKGGRVMGAMQKKFEVVPGVVPTGFECTISVPNLDAAIKSIEALLTVVGGQVVHAAGPFGPLAPPPLPVLPEWSPVALVPGHWRPSSAAQLAMAHGHVCTGACAVHGHAHERARSARIPAADLQGFWGALGCSCFAF